MLRRNFTVDSDRIEENHLYLSSKFVEGKTNWKKKEKEGDFEVDIKDFMWSSPNLRQNSCSASVDCQFCSEGVVIGIWVACWPPTCNPFNPLGLIPMSLTQGYQQNVCRFSQFGVLGETFSMKWCHRGQSPGIKASGDGEARSQSVASAMGCLKKKIAVNSISDCLRHNFLNEIRVPQLHSS